MDLITSDPQATADLDDAVEVLYLEDDPELAELYELKLGMDGYHVRTVPVDARPPRSIKGRAPELFFVDVRSHAAQALESLEAWRRDPRLGNAPAVIVSDLDATRLEQRGIHLGRMDQVLLQRLPVGSLDS